MVGARKVRVNASKKGRRPVLSRAEAYRLITFSGRTCLRGVQGNPNKFPILVQGVMLCMGFVQIRLDRLGAWL